jgi:hypothetical protein
LSLARVDRRRLGPDSYSGIASRRSQCP